MPLHTAVEWNNTGSANALTAAQAGDQIANRPGMFVQYVNSSGAPRTITFAASVRCRFGQLHDAAFTIADGTDTLFGYFPTHRFGRIIDVSYDDPSGLDLVAGYLTNFNGIEAVATSLTPIGPEVKLSPQLWRGDGSGVALSPLDAAGHYFDCGDDLFLILDGTGAGAYANPSFWAVDKMHYGIALNTGQTTAVAGELRRKGPFPAHGRFGSHVLVKSVSQAGWQVALARFDDMRGIGDDPTDAVPALGGSPGTIPVVAETKPPSDGDYIAAPADGAYLPVGTDKVRLLIKNTGSAGQDKRLWIHSPECNHGFSDDVSLDVAADGITQSLEIHRTRFGSLPAITYEDPGTPGVIDGSNLQLVAYMEARHG